jgi:hypothetical protein
MLAIHIHQREESKVQMKILNVRKRKTLYAEVVEIYLQ